METKPAIGAREQIVALAKKHVVAFKSEALMNENLLLTCGALNDTCSDEANDFTWATVTTIVSCSPNPHAVLQYNDECDIQSVVAHDVAESSMRSEAAAVPYMPAACSIELPVDAAE